MTREHWVFLHGTPLTPAVWRPIAERFRTSSTTVSCPSLERRGDSAAGRVAEAAYARRRLEHGRDQVVERRSVALDLGQHLVLRYYGDLSEAQIAHTLGISTGAVKSHASRGMAALRSTLEPWEKSS